MYCENTTLNYGVLNLYVLEQCLTSLFMASRRDNKTWDIKIKSPGGRNNNKVLSLKYGCPHAVLKTVLIYLAIRVFDAME